MCALSIPLSQSRRPRSMHRFGPIGDLQLAQNVGDMVAHRLGTQDEASGDVGIGLALGDQSENFIFAIRQFREELRGSTRCCRSHAAEIEHQALCDNRTKDGLTVSNSANGPQRSSWTAPLSR